MTEPPALRAAAPLQPDHRAACGTDGHFDRVVELARLLALVNTAMADAGIAIWESKFYYKFWRPVTGIRESDEGTGPSLTATVIRIPGETPPTHRSARRPAICNGPNFTPPFPSYPSGHAGFGGALFQVLRNFYGTTPSRSLSYPTSSMA